METATPYAPVALEFWYEFGSNYSYLSVMRVKELAEQYGVPIVWKPFLLGPIFKSFGWESSPFVLQKEKGAYVWQDMARECVKYNLPWKCPTSFPRSALLPMRVALLGADKPWIVDYNKRMMQVNFVEDLDIDNEEIVSKVLTELGLPASQLIAEAQSEDNKRRLRAQTETARQRGIFGAPTFFVDGTLFWGNDRLQDALIFAAGLKILPLD
ncbi:2-hydroxychromene-2-carboxylate isomerase [Solimicrobium silvestre]|nr:2-hydroxychromene-2-carboxylate isomerase [Solimicrobium silvestre]